MISSSKTHDHHVTSTRNTSTGDTVDTSAPAPPHDRAHPRTHTSRAPRPWWVELALVDFRHAFWPWLLILITYIAGFSYMNYHVNVRGITSGQTLSITANGVFIILILFAPAVVARVFGTDHHHGTMPAMLTFPISRSKLWFARLAFIITLYFLPIVLATIATAIVVKDPIGFPTWTLHWGMAAWLHTSFGCLLAVLLKRPLLIWTATLITPFVIGILFVAFNAFPGVNMEVDTGSALLERLNRIPGYFWFTLTTGLIALLTAWRLWLRLEVR